MENPPQDPKLSGVCSKSGSRKNQRQRLLLGILLDYAKNSTLHGLRYITEKGLTIAEKVFWIITFLISLSLCVYLIRNVWVKWKTSPVIVSLSEHLVHVGEVPFPAVTICPQTKVWQEYYNYTAAVDKLQETESFLNFLNGSKLDYKILLKEDYSFKKLFDIDSLCGESTIYERLLLVNFPNISDYTVVHNIVSASPKLEDFFSHCTWRNNLSDCSDLFEPVITREGSCFTFNTLAADEIFRSDSIQQAFPYLNSSTPRKGWTLEHGYSGNEQDTYPKRGRGNGGQPDLSIYLLEYQSMQDPMCNNFREGYKVYLQHPADLPQSSLYYYAALPGQVSSLGLKFSILNTSESLANYAPITRQCYNPEELQLKYFRVYTPSNCRLECLSDYTFQRCGCVWFHMPHSANSTICTLGIQDCVTEAIEDYATKESQNNNLASQCQCLPSCTSIQYDAEILKTSYDLKKRFKMEREVNDKWLKDLKYTKIEMYFKEARFVSMRRSELFGPTEFLANCGGLLGLFLGFSFLSLVEIFYFCTLRLGCVLKKDTLRKKRN